MYVRLVNTSVGRKRPFEVCFHCFFLEQIKEVRCLCCWRLEERKKSSFHLVSLCPGSHCRKARTVFPGEVKLHYLPVSCYLEVAEVKKTNGL